MSTIHQSRTTIAAVAAVLMLGLSAPITVTAEDLALVEEQVLVAEDQGPALAPVAGPSWDETSGYASVEASRATIGHPAANTIGAANDAMNPDYLPAALASGQRTESAYLSTVPLPGEAVETSLAQFRAVELSLSRWLGAEHQTSPSCEVID